MEFFIRQLLKGIGIIFRTIRVFFTRRIAGLYTRFRQLTNISRNAIQATNAALQSATEMAKTPSKREDYIAFGNLLIAKSFLARLALVLAGLGMLVYFILWPWFLSHFLTARFWTEDKRVPDWSGRVIVFADKKKTVPMYAGRLENGLLQGEGREYDADGVLSYEGSFLDGQRSGTGNAYENGVLCYEGQFSQGLYEGTGTVYHDGKTEYTGQFSAGNYHGRGTLYRDGSLLYDGQFDQGLYQGQGALYQSGTLEYQGTFQDGVPSGMGTSYYYDGSLKYEGQFEKGVPDGNGKFYEDGRMVYQGSFSSGLYSGTGTLYPVPGEQIDAEFLDGGPEGTVRWSKNGKLYYEGEWKDNRPNGYGILYTRSGEPAYRGTFAAGSIDGNRLIGMNVDDLRKTLGESSSTAGSGSTFAVTSPRLGLTALCTYQTDNAASQVSAVYLFPPENGDNWFQLLPGTDRAADPADGIRGAVSYTRQNAVPLPSGQYDSIQTVSDAGIQTIFYQRHIPVLVRWSAVSGSTGFTASDSGTGNSGAAAADTGTDALSAGAAALAESVTGMDAVENLLDALDGMESMPAEVKPVAYGDEPVGMALSACQTMETASKLMKALSDYWLQSETEILLADNLSRTRVLLKDAQIQNSMGQDDTGTAEVLQEAVRTLEEQILNCEMEKKQAELTAQSVGNADPPQMNLSQTTVLFDPSKLDDSELPLLAAAYAQAAGDETDPADLAMTVKSSLLRLQENYAAVQTALRQYEAAAQTADSTALQYAMGTGTKSAWYNALSAKNNIRAALYADMNAFTKQAADLNGISGGWVSRTAGWYDEEFNAVLLTQFPDGLPMPEEEKEPEDENLSEEEPDSGTDTENDTKENGADAGKGVTDDIKTTQNTASAESVTDTTENETETPADSSDDTESDTAAGTADTESEYEEPMPPKEPDPPREESTNESAADSEQAAATPEQAGETTTEYIETGSGIPVPADAVEVYVTIPGQ